MLKVHIRPLVNLPERGGFRSGGPRGRRAHDVVIGRREISRAQLIGKSTEGGREGGNRRQNRNSDNGERRKLNLEKE